MKTTSKQRSTIKHSTTIGFAKLTVLEPLLVTQIMVTTNAEGLLYFDSDRSLVIHWCMPTKAIIEALSNLAFFILATIFTTKEQYMEKFKVLGLLNEDISTVVSFPATWKCSQD